MVTGIDLVQAPLRIAGGEHLWFSQDEVKRSGHAIECRIYAEDPSAGWAPSPGEIGGYREPGGPWVRVDAGVYPGATVPLFYDPMVAKLVVWGVDRAQAIQRARRALIEFRIRGISTNIAFFRDLLGDPEFVSGQYDTGFLTAERIAGWQEAGDGVVGGLAGNADRATVRDIATVAAAIAAFERDLAIQRPAAQAGGNSWKWSLR